MPLLDTVVTPSNFIEPALALTNNEKLCYKSNSVINVLWLDLFALSAALTVSFVVVIVVVVIAVSLFVFVISLSSVVSLMLC